jgi:hypothetical protein
MHDQIYTLRILKNQSEYNIEFVNGEFTVGIKSSKQSPAKIKKLYEDWPIENAKSIFSTKWKNIQKNSGSR